MLKRALLASLASGLLAWPIQAQEPTLDEILDNYYEAIGGLEAWQAVQSIKVVGHRSRRPGMEVPYTLLAKRPDKVRVEFTVQGMTGIQAYDGETAWSSMPFGRGGAQGGTGPRVLPPQRASALRQEADIDGPLIGYEQEGHTVELLGKVESEGTPAYKLQVTLENGDVLFYFLDAEYWVPIKVVAGREMRGNTVEFESIISDYKEVGGLMIPHSIETRSAGSERGQSLTIERIELNPEIDDAVFAMPEKTEGDQ